MTSGDPNLQCTFCRKSRKEVALLIAGPGVNICDDCVGLCVDIVFEHMQKKSKQAEVALAALKPDAGGE